MSVNKQKMLGAEEAGYLQYLETLPGLKAEVVNLVREDMECGLSLEQVKTYVDKNRDIKCMKLYSRCLRSGYGMDVIRVLLAEEPEIHRCELAVEFYDRGIPLEGIMKAMDETRNAREMEMLLQKLLKQKEELVRTEGEVPPYAQQLLLQIQEIVGQIHLQENMYGELKRAISILEASKKEEAEKECLLQEIQSRDMQISSQQDELNKGHKKLAKQRAEIERFVKEVEHLKGTVAGLEAKLQEKEEMMKEMNGRVTSSAGVPVYYSVPVVDQGKVVGRVQVEHTKRQGNAPKGLWAKMCGAFMPGQDIVKKVIDAGLDEQQLAQVRTAMEKGLTDIQLNSIINPALSPQKMSEIIDLAVLVNQNQ